MKLTNTWTPFPNLPKNTRKLWYVCYDLMSPETFQERYSELTSILKFTEGRPCPVKLLPCRPYEGNDKMWEFFHESKGQGFEGLILRTDDKGYQAGIRSSSLIKIKEFEDMEVTVLDIVPSADGWGICECVTDSGKKFSTSAPGSIPEKTEALVNKHKYVGKRLTIEFSMLTLDGVPFHPNALRWEVLI